MSKTEQNAATAVKVWMLLDRSGSMGHLQEAVVEGTNRFLQEQRGGEGECRLTLAQFDSQDPFEVLVDAKRIERVDDLTAADYQPRGTTPLYDAIGSLLERAKDRRKQRKRDGKSAEDQVVVIFTDGMENASVEYSRKRIFKRITKRQKQGWTFVFLGANQDSYATGRRLGIRRGGIQNYGATREGFEAASGSWSRGLMSRRSAVAARRVPNRDDFFDGVREAEEQMASEERGRRGRGRRSQEESS